MRANTTWKSGPAAAAAAAAAAAERVLLLLSACCALQTGPWGKEAGCRGAVVPAAPGARWRGALTVVRIRPSMGAEGAASLHHLQVLQVLGFSCVVVSFVISWTALGSPSFAGTTGRAHVFFGCITFGAGCAQVSPPPCLVAPSSLCCARAVRASPGRGAFPRTCGRPARRPPNPALQRWRVWFGPRQAQAAWLA